MKWAIIILILLSCTAYATRHYHHTIEPQQVEMDYVINAVSPLNKLLPPTANITYQDVHTKIEMQFWLRYALAPRYVAWHTHQYDTLLTVCLIAEKDSVINILAGRKLLWQNIDSPYYYALTSLK